MRSFLPFVGLLVLSVFVSGDELANFEEQTVQADVNVKALGGSGTNRCSRVAGTWAVRFETRTDQAGQVKGGAFVLPCVGGLARISIPPDCGDATIQLCSNLFRDPPACSHFDAPIKILDRSAFSIEFEAPPPGYLTWYLHAEGHVSFQVAGDRLYALQARSRTFQSPNTGNWYHEECEWTGTGIRRSARRDPDLINSTKRSEPKPEPMQEHDLEKAVVTPFGMAFPSFFEETLPSGVDVSVLHDSVPSLQEIDERTEESASLTFGDLAESEQVVNASATGVDVGPLPGDKINSPCKGLQGTWAFQLTAVSDPLGLEVDGGVNSMGTVGRLSFDGCEWKSLHYYGYESDVGNVDCCARLAGRVNKVRNSFIAQTTGGGFLGLAGKSGGSLTAYYMYTELDRLFQWSGELVRVSRTPEELPECGTVDNACLHYARLAPI